MNIVNTHTHTEKTKTIYPIAYFICRGITGDMGHVFCMSSHGLAFV